jgi:hypothetical protein
MTIEQIKSAIESANPLTQWHQTILDIWIKLHPGAELQQTDGIITIKFDGKTIIIKG